MRDSVKERLDRIDALFPPERLRRSRERLTRLWHGAPPLDRLPFCFSPLTLDYYAAPITPEERLRQTIDEIVLRGRLEDDFIPAFFPGCHQGTIPGMLGAREIVKESDYTCARVITSVADIEKLPAPSMGPGTVANGWLAMEKYVLEETEGRLPIHVTDMQGPADVCGQLWGYENLLACAYEDGDAYNALTGKVTDAFILLWEAQQRVVGDRFVGTHLWGWNWVPPDAGASLSADSLVMISADFYREFYQPCLETIARRFGGLAVHSCGDFSQVVKAMCATPGLKAIHGGQMGVEALAGAGADGHTLIIAGAGQDDTQRTFNLIRERGLRVDLSIGLTPPEGRPPASWTDQDWVAVRRMNDSVLNAARV